MTCGELVGLLNLREWLKAEDFNSSMKALPCLLETLEHKKDLLKFIDRTLIESNLFREETESDDKG